MRDHDPTELHVDALDAYYWQLAINGTAVPPYGLDPDDVAVLQVLERQLGVAQHDAPLPSPRFVAALRARIEEEVVARPFGANGVAGRVEHDQIVIRPPRQRPASPTRHRFSRASYAVAALLAVLLLAGAVFGGLSLLAPSNAASAREIVQQAAQAVARSDAGVESFVLTERRTIATDNGQRQARTTHWYEASDRWRIETEETLPTNEGTSLKHFGAVADGQVIWDWTDESARVRPLPEDQQDLTALIAFGGGRGDINAALQSASECATPERMSDEMVAGRATYVIDLGPSTCPSASMPETNGRRVIWVDKETFFVLKAVQYDARPGHEGELYSTTEVTSIEYNVALAPELFTYTPPPGLRVIDERVTETTATATATVAETPQPASTPSPSGLAQIRERVSFSVFVPEFVPEGLTPSEPTGGEDTTSLVTIDYLTADGQPGLSVLNGPAGCCLEQAGKDGYAVTLPNGLAAHHVTGQPESGEGILWWTQDSAYIAISGTNLTYGDLLQIAASMSSSADLEQ